MSAVKYIRDLVIPATMQLLPASMNTAPAKAMLLTIGLQESRFEHRSQIGGPAEGFWQFEAGGGWKGVVNHPQTQLTLREALIAMAYGEPDLNDYYAVENNDILACLLARLLLWTHPKRLPQKGEAAYAWTYYTDTWRPGKPHRETWDAFFAEAWRLLEAA